MENRQHQQQQTKNIVKKEDRELEGEFEILLSTFELRLPSSCFRREEKEEDRADEDDELMRTPKSSEPAAVLACPPPPRKPTSAKRKAGCGGDCGRTILMAHDYIFGDMELDLEMLFPSNFLGGKIGKKVKRSVE